ncbi:glycosyltransferase [Alteromonas australica]|uniref:Glycosyl transferase family 1 n=2 Tax=Alteromonas TaxID=226 RepID=A0A075P5R6_9ALTE|nr:glycosyltransferase [Alteromonas australica]AIF98642.1 hypothetical protein EP13_08085 [Alteromonas australica]
MTVTGKDLNVGIVHDWLPTLGGAEKVVQQLTDLYPNSEIYTLFNFLDEKDNNFIGSQKINVSPLNKLPFVEKYYRNLLLQCTRQIEQFDVSRHDVVISSSAALAKGVITSVDQPHICYMHSPARYAWDLSHEYINDIQGVLAPIKRMIAKELIYRYRFWDMRSVNTIDAIISNSNFIKKRIEKVYKRSSHVIYPPVDIEKYALNTRTRDEYYVTASRLVAYKKIDLIVKAFSLNKARKLVVIGDGPELANIKALATPNVEFVGYQEQDSMVQLIQNAKAFVFAAFEDFGIVPVEAQACGTPVICFSKGGTSETVIDVNDSITPTGVYFHEQHEKHIENAITQFESQIDKFSEIACRHNAERFSQKRFKSEISSFVNNMMNRNT